MEDLYNAQAQRIRKVVSRRKIQDIGFKQYEEDVKAWKNEKKLTFASVADVIYDKLTPEHDANYTPGVSDAVVSLFKWTLMTAILLAGLPANVIRKIIAIANDHEIKQLKEIGVYDILMEKIGQTTNYDPNIVTEDVISELGRKR